MKNYLKLVTIVLLLATFTVPAQAQRSSKSKTNGFDYAGHSQLNKKASRWSKRRIKASDGDQTNVQCSVRKSKKHARKKNSANSIIKHS